MITTEGLRWVVTAMFVLTGAFCAYRCVRHGRGTTDRAGDVLHVVMCVAMVAMAWPATMGLARWPQVVVFALAALWFLVVSFRGAVHDGHGGRRVALYHVVMMAAMAWMVFVMPRTMGAGGPGGTTEMPGMPEMSMAVSGAGGSAPADVTIVAVVLLVVFVVAGLVFLSRAIDDARSSRPTVRSIGAGANGVMAFGMGLMLLTMT